MLYAVGNFKTPVNVYVNFYVGQISLRPLLRKVLKSFEKFSSFQFEKSCKDWDEALYHKSQRPVQSSG